MGLPLRPIFGRPATDPNSSPQCTKCRFRARCYCRVPSPSPTPKKTKPGPKKIQNYSAPLNYPPANCLVHKQFGHGSILPRDTVGMSPAAANLAASAFSASLCFNAKLPAKLAFVPYPAFWGGISFESQLILSNFPSSCE